MAVTLSITTQMSVSSISLQQFKGCYVHTDRYEDVETLISNSGFPRYKAAMLRDKNEIGQTVHVFLRILLVIAEKNHTQIKSMFKKP
jgi:hypothetical protein